MENEAVEFQKHQLYRCQVQLDNCVMDGKECEYCVM